MQKSGPTALVFYCLKKNMYKTGGSVEYEKDGMIVKQELMTYSEEEIQENQINKENSKLVFSPKFIPFYPELIKKGLTITDSIIFGFIDFYKSNTKNRFYFTNNQISNIVGCSTDTVSRSISKLEKLGFLSTSRKVKAGGGQIRFINDISYKSDSSNSTSQTRQKLQTNNNKINNNKINKKEIYKEKYLEFVLLTPKQYNKIKKRYGEKILKQYIERLNNYIGSKGKKYKSHYYTILNWISKDNIKEIPNNQYPEGYFD